MSCSGNNYKLLLNDVNKFGVIEMSDWIVKYVEIMASVNVVKEMIDVSDGYKGYVGFNREEMETISADICVN
jgi:hypothetical protein